MQRKVGLGETMEQLGERPSREVTEARIKQAAFSLIYFCPLVDSHCYNNKRNFKKFPRSFSILRNRPIPSVQLHEENYIRSLSAEGKFKLAADESSVAAHAEELSKEISYC